MSYEIAKRIVSGRKVVNPAGTPVQITSNDSECYMVMLSADFGNENPVIVGDSNIVATEGSQRGVVLAPGNPPATFLVRKVSDVWVDAQTSGDAVCFVYFQA